MDDTFHHFPFQYSVCKTKGGSFAQTWKIFHFLATSYLLLVGDTSLRKYAQQCQYVFFLPGTIPAELQHGEFAI
jgi:hypothetical protein